METINCSVFEIIVKSAMHHNTMALLKGKRNVLMYPFTTQTAGTT